MNPTYTPNTSKMALILLTLVLSVNLYSQDYALEKIATPLLERVQDRSSETHSIMVQANSQVDVQALLDSFNINSIALEQRAIHTNKALRDLAEKSRIQLESITTILGLKDVSFFWIINGFTAQATGAQILELTTYQDVSFIDIEHQIEWDEPTDFIKSSELRSNSGSVERDIRIIKAPGMWSRGYTGYGRKALIIDTGVDPSHPSLRRNFAGNVVPETHAWFSSQTFPKALDCDFHGSHVAGTILGIDRNLNDTIGVAYNSMWMGAPGLCGQGSGGTFAQLQWALDPDNDPNTTEDMPDVINNSWFIRELPDECNGTYIQLLTALEAAGIAVVFSAGNAGPNSQTITAPKNINVSLVNSFAVGNIDGRNLNINNGSSRGPSLCGGEGSLFIKPEVSAPGTSVRSAIPGGYALLSGTSMAAPHVSGAILLLKEAFPYLSGEALKLALYFTAIDLGEPGEDNSFGMGLIDVDAAFEYLVNQGNIPIDPVAEFDIAIEEYSFTVDHCTGELYPRFILKNAGRQPIQGFEILSMSGTLIESLEMIYSSSQVIPPSGVIQQIAPLQLKSADLSELSFLVRLIDQEDHKPLNNQIKLEAKHKPVDLVEPILNETIFEKFICSGTHFILKNEDTGTNFLWYQTAEHAQPFLKSNERLIQAPETESTLDFHIGIEIEETILLANKNNTAIEVQPDETTGIEFVTAHDVHLHHFKINPISRTFHMIQLTDDEGNIIWEDNRFYSAGEQTITVNRLLFAGKKYYLSNSANRPVIAYEFEQSEEYRLKDYIDVQSIFINGNQVDEFLPTMHGFHFTAELPCKRRTIQIKVKPSENTPIASFSIVEQEPVNINDIVLFQNESTNADRVLWSFGDGEFSTDFSPSKTFTEPGIFEVALRVWNGSVCNDMQRRTIIVEESTSSINLNTSETTSILIYPNPTNGDLFIELEGATEQLISKCEIISVNGTVLNYKPESDENQLIKIEAQKNGLPSGIYSLRIILHDGSVHIKQFAKI